MRLPSGNSYSITRQGEKVRRVRGEKEKRDMWLKRHKDKSRLSLLNSHLHFKVIVIEELLVHSLCVSIDSSQENSKGQKCKVLVDTQTKYTKYSIRRNKNQSNKITPVCNCWWAINTLNNFYIRNVTSKNKDGRNHKYNLITNKCFMSLYQTIATWHSRLGCDFVYS